jgi:hypothetical protein
LENRHSIGPMENIMETIHITNKVRMIDTIERCTFSMKQNNSQFNDRFTVKPNIIFKTIVHKDPYIEDFPLPKSVPPTHSSVI